MASPQHATQCPSELQAAKGIDCNQNNIEVTMRDEYFFHCTCKLLNDTYVIPTINLEFVPKLKDFLHTATLSCQQQERLMQGSILM